ncbi:MAG: hypothetical protein R3272_15460, partial [Candidatus Promineifilaceae bacterium]|nr:hypothetical protein [Candidatus Promineifilaceae bacterium]
MISALTDSPRLPGVLCEVQAPRDENRPLRLDVAGFVGFAERGPLDLPVIVEDFNQYRRIFGGDLPLARAGGRPVYAHLARAVELFFENGGVRCYVVRVTGLARRNHFTIPGLLWATESGLEAATAPAAWVGRWSDLLSLATVLRLLPLRIRTDSGVLTVAGDTLAGSVTPLPVRAAAPDALRAGDLVRLLVEGSADELFWLYAPVAAVAVESGGPSLSGRPLLLELDPTARQIFRINPLAFVPEQGAWLDGDRWQTLPFTASEMIWQEPAEAGAPYRLSLPVDPALALEAGALVALSAGDERLFFRADSARREHDDAAAEPVRLVLESAFPLLRQETLPAEP